MSAFLNNEERKAWVESQKIETLCAVASRVAARSFPTIASLPLVEVSRLDLAVVRSILTSMAFVHGRDDNRTKLMSAARSSASTLVDTANKLLGNDSSELKIMSSNLEIFAADSASSSCRIPIKKSYFTYTLEWSETAIEAALKGSIVERKKYFDSLNLDIKRVENGASPIDLLESPLWDKGFVANEVDQLWAKLRERWKKDILKWSFWLDWYENLLAGGSVDLSMIEQIALIPSIYWDGGPSAVSQEIERLRLRELKDTIDLEENPTKVEALFANPKTNSAIATTLYDEVEEAVSTYLHHYQTNDLPPAISTLRRISITALRLAEASQSKQRVHELEDQLSILTWETECLSNEVQQLKELLIEAGNNSLLEKAIETSVVTSVQILTTGFWASVAAAISHFTGILDVSSALEKISEFGATAPDLLPDPKSHTSDVFDI